MSTIDHDTTVNNNTPAIEGVAQILSDLSKSEQPEPAEETLETVDELETSEVEETLDLDVEPDPVEEPDEDGINTIAELAGQLGVETSELYALNIGLGDGRDPISLGELKDVYQESLRITQGKDQFESEREAFRAEQENKTRSLTEQLNAYQAIPQELINAEASIKAIEQQFNNTDWNTMDPGQAALAKQNLQLSYNAAVNNRGAIAQQAQQAMNEQQDNLLASQKVKLLKAIPDWSNDETFRNDRTAITNMMTNDYGFTEQEAGGLNDHRVVKLLHDFAKLKGKVNGINTNAKKVKKVPKYINPGAVRNSLKGQKASLEKLSQAASKSRDTGTKVNAIAELLKSRSIR